MFIKQFTEGLIQCFHGFLDTWPQIPQADKNSPLLIPVGIKPLICLLPSTFGHFLDRKQNPSLARERSRSGPRRLAPGAEAQGWSSFDVPLARARVRHTSLRTRRCSGTPQALSEDL